MHWQAGDRPLPSPPVTVAGESALFVDPGQIPAATDVAALGQALAAGRRGHLDELMATTAAYTGLRWGELAALAADQINTAAGVITVDRKVAEIAGHLYLEAPKNRKRRQTIYPTATPVGYPLAERLAARLQEARAEQAGRDQPARAAVPVPLREVLAVLQLQPQRPQTRLQYGGVARPRRERGLDLA